MADTPNEYSFRLTLEVIDDGRRTFSAERDAADQSSLATAIAWELDRMLAILNCPPTAAEVAGAMEGGSTRSLIGLLAYLHDKWDGGNNFEDCVRLVVDIGKLCASDDEESRHAALAVARSSFATRSDLPAEGEGPS